MTEIDGQSLDDPSKPAVWDKTTAEGRRIMQRLVDLEMPIVAAVNGPASVHSEYVLLADIVITADTTVFSDFPHLTFGIVPGDGRPERVPRGFRRTGDSLTRWDAARPGDAVAGHRTPAIAGHAARKGQPGGRHVGCELCPIA